MPVRLGLNCGRHGRTFGTVSDAFSESSAYWGERGDWYVVAAKTRDSDTLDESNFDVLKDRLGGAAVVETAGHWACGTVYYLLIPPNGRKAIKTALQAHRDYDRYPVLDESHFSGLEWNKFWSFAESELKSLSDEWGEVLSDVLDTGNFYIGDESSEWDAIEAARERLEAAQNPA